MKLARSSRRAQTGKKCSWNTARSKNLAGREIICGAKERGEGGDERGPHLGPEFRQEM